MPLKPRVAATAERGFGSSSLFGCTPAARYFRAGEDSRGTKHRSPALYWQLQAFPVLPRRPIQGQIGNCVVVNTCLSPMNERIWRTPGRCNSCSA